MVLFTCFILINLLGFTILKFENTIVQLLGLVLVILGTTEAIAGRHFLGNNWTESYEYQIKKEHNLIVNGIYKFVRHPIYGGLMIAITGAFMVTKTYMFIPILFFQIIIMTYFAKREESLLLDHFGNKYKEYIEKTKMFLPLIY